MAGRKLEHLTPGQPPNCFQSESDERKQVVGGQGVDCIGSVIAAHLLQSFEFKMIESFRAKDDLYVSETPADPWQAFSPDRDT